MNNNKLYFYIAPYLIWMSLFFVIPTLLVVIVSFIDQSSWDTIITVIRNFHPNIKTDGLFVALQKVGEQVVLTFTFDAYRELLEPRVTVTIFRTFVISLISAIVCMVLSIPTAHYISRSSQKNTWLMLLILPFWTNFLIRIFIWIKILGNNGMLNNFLQHLYIISKPLPLLYNNFAVTLLSIYICLPFAIIPIFSAIEKFDFSLWEVSDDLGAKPWQSFFYVYLPSIKNGVISAFIFAFINTFGNYAVAKLVGGQSSYVLGSLVVHNATVGRNMPLAAAISTVICSIALLLMLCNYPKELKGNT
ncbi:MAG: ABC transporter permease [Spirochaetota bacterium]|nr:ABC transporter permease [Spirochaetota bacterium]